MSAQAEALDRLIAAVEAGEFPDDITARQLGMTAEYGGLPIIKTMYAAFSGSLDAAKALHDALLPGWAVKLWAWVNDDADAQVYPPVVVDRVGYERVEGVDIFSAETDGNNLARAWLLAILRAYRGTLE